MTRRFLILIIEFLNYDNFALYLFLLKKSSPFTTVLVILLTRSFAYDTVIRNKPRNTPYENNYSTR